MTQTQQSEPRPDLASSRVRFQALDGWRGISILVVMACHMFPLGPRYLGINETAGPFGMSLFFILSGFLITTTLLDHPDWRSFLIRRACRILPLAIVYLLITLAITHQSAASYLPHLLFYMNYLPQDFDSMTFHFWSLCVELHFYLFVALAVMCAGSRSLWSLPFFGLAVTLLRILTSTPMSIETHLRVDDILAGATLALLFDGAAIFPLRKLISKVPVLIWLALLIAASHPAAGPLNYARPYFAMALVGKTLWERNLLTPLLHSRFLKYCALISYALYVLHPYAAYGWLGTGDRWTLYLFKRPLAFAIIFLAAHISTMTWEKKWIQWGKQWTKKHDRKPAQPLPATPTA